MESWAEKLLSDLAVVTVERTEAEREHGHTRVVAGSLQGFIPLEGVIDLEAERARLDKAIAEAEADHSKAADQARQRQLRGSGPSRCRGEGAAKQAEAAELLETLRAQRAAL
jgi:valyl-tRNA synthetase